MKLLTFECTLPGFNGGTDATDHLVKWVQAQDEDTARQMAEKKWGQDIKWIGQIEDVDVPEAIDLVIRNKTVDLREMAIDPDNPHLVSGEAWVGVPWKVYLELRAAAEQLCEEISTGIDEGLYQEEDNAERLRDIKQALSIPPRGVELYGIVSGGLFQGASASVPMAVQIYDVDNWKEADAEEREGMESPDEWDEFITVNTENGSLFGVY